MSVLRRQQLGSLLLEILLGMTLLIIAVMAVFALFPAGDRAVVSADRATQAHHLARRLLETEMSKEYGALTVGLTEGRRQLQHSRRNGVDLSTTLRYQVEISVPEPDRELKRVLVRVSWEKGSGETAVSPPIILESVRGRVF